MDVVSFGEAIFRTVTSPGERLSQAQNLGFFLGGTDLNLVANLKSLGVSTAWVSVLPAGPTGEMILQKVKSLGVDTSHCTTSLSSQVAWYMMESGSGPRPDVVYHRNASCMADEKSFVFDWKRILTGAKIFHTSGITCGLSHVLTAEVQKAMKQAQEQKILVSYDFNYRKNIWTIEEFVLRQKDLIGMIDILFCSRADLKLFFGDDFEKNKFAKVFSSSKIQTIVLSQRDNDNREYAIEVVRKEKLYQSKKYPIQLIDRVGIGDSAAAGFLKIFLQKGDFQKAADWAAVAGAFKYGIKGDMALLQETEIDRAMQSNHSGIIR
jgi:2-dehydro-3-deoxygluconokinase